MYVNFKSHKYVSHHDRKMWHSIQHRKREQFIAAHEMHFLNVFSILFRDHIKLSLVVIVMKKKIYVIAKQVGDKRKQERNSGSLKSLFFLHLIKQS